MTAVSSSGTENTRTDALTLFPPPDGHLATIGLGELELDSGEVLPDTALAVQRWGRLSPHGDNVVLVEHALTGDSHLTGPADSAHPSPGWWNGLIGPGAPLDTDRWCVMAANVLGGCRGSTGPASLAPDGRPWGSRFPDITIRDQVAAERMLADVLGITRFAAVVGGSLGGMRALEWTVGHPDRVASAVVIAVGARASADQIGTQSTQVAAIRADPDWQGGDYHTTEHSPTAGLGVARRIAHLSYRTDLELDERFGNAGQDGEDPWAGGRFAVQSYLDHQADKLTNRFDPASYVVLCEAMSRHDVGRGRGGIAAALTATTVPVTVAGVDSDRLYPLHTQRELAEFLPGCTGLRVITSRFGHDAFLIERKQISQLLCEALTSAESAVCS